MSKFKPGYYTADTVHGVQYKEDWMLDSPDSEVIFPLDFLDGLPYVQEGEIIVTWLEPYHEDIFTEIKENYGIAKNHSGANAVDREVKA